MQYKEDVDMVNISIDKNGCGRLDGVKGQAKAGDLLIDGVNVFSLGYDGPEMEI